MRKPTDPLTAESLSVHLRGLLPPRSRRLLLAYSGGRDSHVLLHLLSAARHTLGRQVSAIHINHGLHADAGAWAGHCREVCAALAVPLTVLEVAVDAAGRGLEAAARDARYTALKGLMEDGDCLLTAHHRDDQVETQWLHLLRGTGITGLGAMRPGAKLGPGYLLRPLLDWPRAALEQYAAAARLRWVEDSSNQDTELNRNFLRHEVLPLVRQRWPGLDQVVARNAAHWQDAVTVLDELARRDWQQCGAGVALRIPEMLMLSPARQRVLLRYWLQQRQAPMPSSRQLAEIERLARDRPRSGQGCVRWSGVALWRHRDHLSLQDGLDIRDPGTLAWPDPAQTLMVQGTGYQLSMQAVQGAGLKRAALAGKSLSVRLRQGGERCRLPGRQHHSTLKKLLQAASVPPWERSRMPLIYVDNELAAVADRWVCAPFAAGPDEPGWQLRWQAVHEN